MLLLTHLLFLQQFLSMSNITPTKLHASPPQSSSSSSSSPSSSEKITILGFGSLLSKKSSQLTFPNLSNFRLGKINNYRRVFAHPASIFFQRNIVNYDTLEMSSLSAEYCIGASFICSVFEVPNDNGAFMEKRKKKVKKSDEEEEEEESSLDHDDVDVVASMAFREREEEFDIVMVPYEELQPELLINVPSDESSSSTKQQNVKMGVLCCRSTDETYIKLWGKERFDEHYGKYNIQTIWNWKEDSGLKPCGPYLRHCVLASKNMGDVCHDSFLDDTFLVDRKTTIRSYLNDNPHVMDTLPPPELQARYGG